MAAIGALDEDRLEEAENYQIKAFDSIVPSWRVLEGRCRAQGSDYRV